MMRGFVSAKYARQVLFPFVWGDWTCVLATTADYRGARRLGASRDRIGEVRTPTGTVGM